MSSATSSVSPPQPHYVPHSRRDHELASHHGDGAALRVTVQRDARFFARAERRDDFWRDFDAGRDFAALQDGHREFY